MPTFSFLREAWEVVYAYWGPWLFVLLSVPIFLSLYAKTRDEGTVAAAFLGLGALGYLFPPEFHVVAFWFALLGVATLIFRVIRGE